MAGLRAKVEVAEPFSSDPRFWRSVAASADAAAMLVLAIAAAVAIALTVGGAWAALPFVLPLLLLVHAGVDGVASSRNSRASFVDNDQHQWRDAERHAVARVFVPVLLRPRW